MTTKLSKSQLRQQAIIKVFNKQRQRYVTVQVPSGLTVGADGSEFTNGIRLYGPIEFKTTTAPEATSMKLYAVGSTLYFNGSEVGSGGGGAPTDAQYVTLATDSTLTDERVLTAGSNITITDDPAGSTVTIAASAGAGGWTDDGTDVRLTTATDQVGIGTASPGTKLEIEVADSENLGGLLIDFNETGNYNALEVDSESTTYYAAYIHGKYPLWCEQDIADGRGITVSRNIAEAGSYPLAQFVDDNTSNTQTTVRIQQDGAGDILNLFDGGTEVFTVLDGGNVGIGTTSPSYKLHVSTDTATEAEVGITQYNNSTAGDGANLRLRRARGTAASPSVVQDDDNLGSIHWYGYDTTDFNQQAASIWCEVDGTPGADDMPGRLVFYTADGGSSTEVMRLTSTARVGIGTDAPSTVLHVEGDAVTIGNGSAGPGEIRLLEDTDLGSYYGGFKAGNLTENTTYVLPTSLPASNKVLQSDSSGVLSWATERDLDNVGWTAPGAGEIATTGSLAIGIATSPAERLEVEDADGTATTLQISNSGAGDPQLSWALSGVKKFTAGVDDSDDDKFKIGTDAVDNNTVLTIDMSVGGYLGLGTTTPSEAMEIETAYATTTLQINNTAVDGDSQLAFALGGTKKFTMGVDDTDDKFKIGTTAVSTSTMFTIDANGKVGIGETSPEGFVNIKNTSISPLDDVGTTTNYHLHIQGSATNDESSGIAFGSTAGNVGSAIIYKDVGGYAQGELQFYTKESTSDGADPVQRMVIDNAGYIGIGATAPEAYLDIKNTVDDGQTNRTMLRLHNYRTDDADVNDFAPTSIDFVVENVTGGAKSATSRISAVSAPIGTDHTVPAGEKSSALIFSTMNDETLAEAVRINNLGRLGIGTAAPAGSLDVKGDGSTSQIFLLSGSGAEASPDESSYADVNFFVSGAMGSKDSAVKGTALFGGDVVASGSFVSLASGSFAKTVLIGLQRNEAFESADGDRALLQVGNADNSIADSRKGGIIGLVRYDSIITQDGFLGAIKFTGTDGSSTTGEKGGAVVQGSADNSYNTNTKSGKLEFLTTPAGSVTPVKRMTVGSAGVVSIDSSETSYEDTSFWVSGSIGSKDSSTKGTSVFGGDVVVSGSLGIDSLSALRIGVLPVTASIVDIGWDPATAGTATGATLRLTSHDTGIDTNTTLGTVEFWGLDGGTGSGYAAGAKIIGQAKGTWGNNDNPAELQFYTTKDGTSSFTQHLTITHDGRVARTDGGAAPSSELEVVGLIGDMGVEDSTIMVVHGMMGDTSGSIAFRQDSAATSAALVLEGGGDFVLVNSASNKDIIFKVNDGGTSRQALKIDASEPSILFLSGGAAASPNESSYTDTNFFVSGTKGSKDSSTRGTALFGGDVVISGTLYGGTPLKIAGGLEVTGTMELKPVSGPAIIRNPHGPVKVFANTDLKLGTGNGVIDLLDLDDGAAGQILLAGAGALAERSVEINSPGTLFFTGSVGGAFFKGPMDVDGNLVPHADNAYDLGAASRRFRNIYTGDLHLQNERGHWQIVEERDYLCVVNRLTGKRYKMMLEPIDDDESTG